MVLWLMSAYLIENIEVIVVSTALCDIAAYFVQALGPALLIERFGMSSFSHNWGFIMLGFAVMTSVLLIIFGAVYDNHTDPLSKVCYGMDCYSITFLVSAGVSIVALLCSVVYHIKRKYKPESGSGLLSPKYSRMGNSPELEQGTQTDR